MKLAMMTGCAVALSLVGAAGARAETIYVTEPAPFATGPAYVYDAPAPLVAPGTVVAEPGYPVVTEPRTIVVQRPPAYVVERSPGFLAPPRVYESRRAYERPRIYGSSTGRIEAQYATPGSCTMDINGFERCY